MPGELPSEMEAVRLEKFDTSYTQKKVPVPKPGKGELLVQLATASYCHTDSMVVKGMFPSHLPMTPSHEGSGVIAAIGEGVEGFSEGQRVMCPAVAKRCGECISCRGPEGRRHYCPNAEYRGVTVDGSFAQYQIVDAVDTNVLPDGVGFDIASPLACAGRTIWRAIKVANVPKGEWLAIVGSGGGLGHIGIQFAKGQGIRVIGVDAKDKALEMSKELGAELAVDARPGKEEAAKKVQKETDSEGAYASIVLAEAEGATALACAITKPHGIVVQVAQPKEVSIPFMEFIFRDIQVKGSLLCSKEEADEMLAYVAEKGLDVRMEKVVGLDKVKGLVEKIHKGEVSGKGVVIIDEKLAG